MIGLLGGTFDPVHNGHLRLAYEVMVRLELEQLRFIPSHQPPHRRQPVASAKQRLSMLQHAIKGIPKCVVDDREYHRDGPSYMVDTLRSLRDEMVDQPLCLIMGADAFMGLAEWHEWRTLFDLAHIVVAGRPGSASITVDSLNEALVDACVNRVVDEAALLRARPAGYVFYCDVTQLDISATAIRDDLAKGLSPQFLVPESVLEDVRRQNLYLEDGERNAV